MLLFTLLPLSISLSLTNRNTYNNINNNNIIKNNNQINNNNINKNNINSNHINSNKINKQNNLKIEYKYNENDSSNFLKLRRGFDVFVGAEKLQKNFKNLNKNSDKNSNNILDKNLDKNLVENKNLQQNFAKNLEKSIEKTGFQKESFFNFQRVVKVNCVSRKFRKGVEEMNGIQDKNENIGYFHKKEKWNSRDMYMKYLDRTE